MKPIQAVFFDVDGTLYDNAVKQLSLIHIYSLIVWISVGCAFLLSIAAV